MTDQELNEKLARWRGFKENLWSENGGWIPSEKGYEGSESIDFPNDLNAIFKWLVPNIPDISTVSIVVFINDKGITYSAFIYTLCGHYTTTEKHYATPARALAEAIGQMIDGKQLSR